MNSHNTILSEIKVLVLEVTPSAVLESDEDYGRSMVDIGIDSLDSMSLLLKVQDKFSIEIPNEVADSFNDIRSIAKYVAESGK